MIDERTLTDPSRCPSCAAGLASSRCGTCGVELGGETGRALWTVSHQAAGLLARRQSLIATLRAEVGAVVPAATATRPVRPPELAEAAQTAVPTQSGLPVPPLPAVGGAPATPYAVGSRWSVSQLLLGLGAVLVGVAACTFLVVSWSLLGVGGRAAVLTGITALAVAASRLSARRGLRSTTEAMAVVATALSLLDVWGAFRADVAGAGQVSGLLWWAGALGTVSALALACAIVVPATTYRVAAAAFAQVAAMLVVQDVADRGSHPHAVWAVGLTLLTLATLATATAMPASWPRHARWTLVVGGVFWSATGLANALAAAFSEDGSTFAGVVVLLALAALAVAPTLPVAGRLLAPAAVRPVLRGIGTALVVLAAWAVVAAAVTDDQWRAVSQALAAYVVLLACRALPRPDRLSPAAVALAATLLPVLSTMDDLAASVEDQWGALPHVWSGAVELTPADAAAPCMLLLAAVALVTAEHLVRLDLIGRASVAAVPFAALALVTMPAVVSTSGLLLLVLELAAGAALVAGAAWLSRSGRLSWALTSAVSGLVLLTLATMLSLQEKAWTLSAIPVVSSAFLAAYLLGPRSLRLTAAVATSLAAGAELVTAMLAADHTSESGGLALTCASGVAAVAVLALHRRASHWVAAAASAQVVGLVLSVSDPDRLWVALLASGLTAAAASVLASLPRLGWVCAVLLTASSWVRLALSDVTAPEPYTVPAGVALLALGRWRRRDDDTYSSWRAYGSGLVLAMGPSLVKEILDGGAVRALALGLAALAVLSYGVWGRLQAPLLVGAAVVAADALVQLSPVLIAAYHAVPRWSVIATAGVLLLAAGATYENRMRDLRSLRAQITSLV